MLALPYGADSHLNLELEDEALVAFCDAPRGKPLDSVSSSLRKALAAPLEFPPLAQSALPGDKVVLALDHGVPQGPTIVAETILALTEGGVAASDIALVRSQADVDAGAPDPLGELPESLRAAVTCQVHDPANRDSLSYLAAATDARPIYINRAIHDADLVISIGVLRLAGSLGYYGINSALVPAFSDAKSYRRYHSPKAARRARQTRLRRQADEVGWLLGLQFTIQVVPGRGDQVLHVLAGELSAVGREGRRLCNSAWSFEVAARASLVVATIEGDRTQQTWENVGRALAAATRALDDGGAIVLCTELAESLGPGLKRIVGAEDLDVALAEISRGRPSDALEAAQLARALSRSKLYLVSKMSDETVEELGVLPLQAAAVSRVTTRYPSCIVLANAHYAQARPENEATVRHAAEGQSR